MSDAFDGYHTWLGIPPAEQPPNHYRLLAITEFESSLDVIENAADGRMSHLRKLNTSKHAADAQKILNEVSAARVCLLDPKRKAAYDARLKAELDSRKPKPLATARPLPTAKPLDAPPAQPVAVSPIASGPSEGASVRGMPGRRSRADGGLIWKVAAGVGAAAVVIVLIVVLVAPWKGGDPPPKELSANDPAADPAFVPNMGSAVPAPPSAVPAVDPPAGSGAEDPFQAVPAPDPVAVPPADPPGGGEPMSVVANPPTPEQPIAPAAIPPAESVPPAAGPIIPLGEPAVVPAPPVAARPAVPDAEKLREADKLVRELFAKELAAARRPNEKGELAGVLRGHAEAAREDLVSRYVLLTLAGDLACQAGEPLSALKAADLLADSFEIDRHALRAGYLKRVSAVVLLPAVAQELLDAAARSTDEALAAEQIEAAGQLAQVELAAAQKIRDPALVRRATERGKDAAAMSALFAEVGRARATLADRPDDPAARAVVGRWLWFARNEPEAGIAHLAGSDDAALIDAAKADAASPTDADARIAVADAWWSVAEPRPAGVERTRLLERAEHWWRLAIPDLTGLARIKVDRQLAEVEKLLPPRERTAATNEIVEWVNPANLGPQVNAAEFDMEPFVSADELELYFASLRSGGPGRSDLWVATRPTKADSFGRPVCLDLTVNSPGFEHGPKLVGDGLVLLFHADGRPGGYGDFDLWMSVRRAARDPFGAPANLGPTLNSTGFDGHAALSADGLTLLFASDRTGGLGKRDLWISTRRSNRDPFGAPLNMGAGVNSSHEDSEPALSGDGLMLIFTSDRPGGIGQHDLWMCTRTTPRDAWGEPVNLGRGANSPSDDRGPCIAADGQTVYFSSSRSGGSGGMDIWTVRRKAGASASQSVATTSPAGTPSGNADPAATRGPALPKGATPKMYGRATLDGVDTGLVFTYEPGKKFQHATLREQFSKYSLGGSRIRVEMLGFVYVPKAMTVSARHKGGSASGGVLRLYCNAEISAVGDDRSKDDTRPLPLAAGVHPVRWVLTGGELSDNNMIVFTDSETGAPLTIFSTAELSSSITKLPTRAVVDVSTD